jgi:hypothetical protein
MSDSQPAAGAGSFEFYDGIRILIPGALVAALFACAAATFTGKDPKLPGGALGAITLSVLAGLVLYYVDAPAKSAAFRKDLPNAVLDEWGLKPPVGTRGTLNTFFVLLDEMMPAQIRARAWYSGSIYRIGLEVIYLLSLTSAGVLTAAAVLRLPSGATSGTGGPLPLPLTVGSATIAAAVFTFVVYLEGRRPKPPDRRGPLAEAFSQAASGKTIVGIAGFAVIAAVLAVLPGEVFPAAISVTVSDESWRKASVGVAVAATWWCGAARYFRGHDLQHGQANAVPGPETEATTLRKPKKPLDPPAAVLVMLPAFALTLLASACSNVLGGTGLPPKVAAGWAAAYLLALVIVASRGHEKRLHGSYATQRTWLRYNEKAMRLRYDTAWTPPEPLSALPASQPPSRDRWWRRPLRGPGSK